jgi:hypothetical protein
MGIAGHLAAEAAQGIEPRLLLLHIEHAAAGSNGDAESERGREGG